MSPAGCLIETVAPLKSRRDYFHFLLTKGIEIPSSSIARNDSSSSLLKEKLNTLSEVYIKFQEKYASESVVDEVKKKMERNADEMDVETQLDEDNTVKKLIASRKASVEEKELKHLKTILNGPATHEIVANKFNIDMTRAKIVCLNTSRWLNDEIISYYMCMLQERDTLLAEKFPQRRRPSHFFNSFFMEKLLQNGQYNYGNVKRWTKKFDIFEKDKIFIPINLSNSHWTLCVVYMRAREIHYYDSMSGSGRSHLPSVLQWIVDEGREKKNMVVNREEWKLIDREKRVPQQRNGVDCGVFSIVCADFINDNLPIESYHQGEMENYRLKIGAAILRGSIDYPLLVK